MQGFPPTIQERDEVQNFEHGLKRKSFDINSTKTKTKQKKHQPLYKPQMFNNRLLIIGGHVGVS